MDERLLAALRQWFANEWTFDTTVYVASELFGRQVELLSRTGMQVRFELWELGKTGAFLVFG